jgi:hypothetical protein
MMDTDQPAMKGAIAKSETLSHHCLDDNAGSRLRFLNAVVNNAGPIAITEIANNDLRSVIVGMLPNKATAVIQ